MHPIPPGTDVIYTNHGRASRHQGHRALVLSYAVKVAGQRRRRPFYKYRLYCLEPNCTGRSREFSAHPSGMAREHLSLVAVMPPRRREDTTSVIESPRYEATRRALIADPIIQALAHEVGQSLHDPKLNLVHEDGSPTFSFTTAALEEYHKRGGQVPTHIGGPAQAILRLLAQEREGHGAQPRPRFASGSPS